MTGSPTDYVAEWKSGSALRQKIIIIINRLQSKNRARPMAVRLKKSICENAVTEIYSCRSLVVMGSDLSRHDSRRKLIVSDYNNSENNEIVIRRSKETFTPTKQYKTMHSNLF